MNADVCLLNAKMKIINKTKIKNRNNLDLLW